MRQSGRIRWPWRRAGHVGPDRRGLLDVGDVAVIVVAAAAHRDAAFDACRYVIEEIKLVRAERNLGLKEAKDLADAYVRYSNV